MEDKKMLEINDAFDLFVTGLSLSNVKDFTHFKKKIFKDFGNRHDLVCSFILGGLNHYVDIALYDNGEVFDKLNINFSVPKNVGEDVLNELQNIISNFNESFYTEQFGSVYHVEARNLTNIDSIKGILDILSTKAYGNV